MTTKPLRRTAVAIALGAAALAPASASAAGIGGGGTTLKLDKKVAKALTGLGIKVTPTGNAKAGAGGITFPVTGGRLDGAAGTIRHSGGLRLKAGKTSVTLSDYVVNTKQKTVTAKVNGGKRLKAFVPVLGKAKIKRDGLDTVISNVSLHLSTPAAKALNKLFGTSALKGRLKLGKATLRLSPSQIEFQGGQTNLALDPAAVDAITSLGITPAPVEPSTANPDGSLAFPITGGALDAKSLAGTITHSGGITLARENILVKLTDFTIDTAKATLSARLNDGDRVDILTLGLENPNVTIDGRTVTVAGVEARLTEGAAAALNAAFSTTAFTPGLLLGTATVVGEAA